MIFRLFALVVVFIGLAAFDPPWLVVEVSDLAIWIATTRPEEAAAAVLRVVALVGAGTQLGAVVVCWVAASVGDGAVERLARRAIVPALRAAIPVAIAAGPAAPAIAAPVVVPVSPTPIARDVTTSQVVVAPGDSMWTIAADHANGDVAGYWRRVVGLNRTRFANVDLIHPGDVVLLPDSADQGEANPSQRVVEVGIDEHDGLPDSERQPSVDDGNDDGRSDEGRKHVVPPVTGRTMPMIPPIVGG